MDRSSGRRRSGEAPPNHAFNIVSLRRFTRPTNGFNVACSAFANALWATPPFDRLGLAINVFRVNVSSTDSGADDPVAAEAQGTGATFRRQLWRQQHPAPASL